MRVFLTGNHEQAWRTELGEFFAMYHIDVFDSTGCAAEFFPIFKQLKMLEGCDSLIANFSGMSQQRLMALLEVSYASKLAKEVMIIADIPRKLFWGSDSPYSKVFADVAGLKDYLTQTSLDRMLRPRLVG